MCLPFLTYIAWQQDQYINICRSTKNQLQTRSLDRIRFSINSRTTNLSVVTTGYLWVFLTVTYLWFGTGSQKKNTTHWEGTMASLFPFKKCINSQFCQSHVLKRRQGGDNSSVTFPRYEVTVLFQQDEFRTGDNCSKNVVPSTF